MRRRLLGAIVLALSLAPHAARAGPGSEPAVCVEPPPEEPEGADYEMEPADSLDDGLIELGVGASGRVGAKPRQTRRVRFSDRGLGGSVREGAGDPLAGGSIETTTLAGRLGVGRLAPRWGRGLLLGSAAEPWSVTADDRGAGARYRGRTGRGAWYRAGRGGRVETLYGRFGDRDLMGGNARAGSAGLGLLADRRGQAQASLCLVAGRFEHELAADRAGRWRAEAAFARRAGPVSLAVRVRGGLAGFRSLAEPRRGGPAQVMAVECSKDAPRDRVHALGALWRYRPGRAGARAALEVGRRLGEHESLAFGFEERHGTHRESGRDPGYRQGAWCEWRGGGAGMTLAIRHEVLGAGRLGRAALRTVTAARFELAGPAGTGLRVTHCAYRVRPGESLYLTEASSDRIVLRAVSGTGRRTRVEVRAPGAGGHVRAALDLPTTVGSRAGAAPRPQWTLDWTRRARNR